MNTIIMLLALTGPCPDCPDFYRWQMEYPKLPAKAPAKEVAPADLIRLAEKITELCKAISEKEQRPWAPPTQNLNHAAEIADMREKIESLQKQVNDLSMDVESSRADLNRAKGLISGHDYIIQNFVETASEDIHDLKITSAKHEHYLDRISAAIVWCMIIFVVCVFFMFVIWVSTPSGAADSEDEEIDEEELLEEGEE